MESIRSKGNLQSLIPIAVVIAGGCESCAEKMVKQALAQGSSFEDVDTTLLVLADMQKRACVAQALGAEFVARMTQPLAAGRRTLEEAMAADATACGCTVSSAPA